MRKSRVAIFISDKIDFKTKTMSWGREGHYIIFNGVVQQEEITLINIYEPKIGTLNT